MTRDELLISLKALVPEAERDAIDTPNTLPVYQAAVAGLAAQSERRLRRSEAAYLLPHSFQQGPPASFTRPAQLVLTLTRTGSLDNALIVAPGKMLVTGPSGRLYANVDPIEYARRDESADRTVLFECTVPGEVGNLDFLVSDDVNAATGKPLGTFREEHLGFLDQSRGRVNTGASVVLYEGSSTIKDSGIPSTFEAGDRGLYVEILFSATMANIGKRYRIREHRWPGIEEPAGSNIRPTFAILDDHNIPELLLAAFQDDGGVFTDYTQEANNQAPGDVPLLPAVPAVDDAFYFGCTSQINAINLLIASPADGDFSVSWEIWDGFAWVSPPDLLDNTIGLTAPGGSRVSIETLQVPTTVNGVLAFWVRVRVSAFVSITAAPVASYVVPLCYEPLPLEDFTLEWAVRDWKDLGMVISAARHHTLGRDDDLGLLGDNRGMYRQEGETEAAFRERIARIPDVVSPNALTRVVNRVLAPLKKIGRVVDIGDEVKGFFLDVDALDYYGLGDIYPQNKWKLLLNIWEAYGFFYVEVPWLNEDDFGMFYDEGPTLLLPQNGLFIGPCYDDGFYDGYSQQSSQTIYKVIDDEIRRRKAGGVDYAILPNSDLNAP